MAIYDFKPSIFEAVGNGSYFYRWDISEVECEPMHALDPATPPEVPTTRWQSREVVVWGTVTRDKITQAVIHELWPNDYEKKLINDHNAATLALLPPSCTETYNNFLRQRHAIKQQINADCDTLNIL